MICISQLEHVQNLSVNMIVYGRQCTHGKGTNANTIMSVSFRNKRTWVRRFLQIARYMFELSIDYDRKNSTAICNLFPPSPMSLPSSQFSPCLDGSTQIWQATPLKASWQLQEPLPVIPSKHCPWKLDQHMTEKAHFCWDNVFLCAPFPCQSRGAGIHQYRVYSLGHRNLYNTGATGAHPQIQASRINGN